MRLRFQRRVACLALSLLGLAACGTDPTPRRAPPPPALVSIAVAPTGLMLEKGATQALSASGVYDDGSSKDLTAEVAWHSTDASIVTVSPLAEVTAVAVGSADVFAVLGAVRGSVAVTVTPSPPVSLTIEPHTATVAYGGKRQLAAFAELADGTRVDVTASAGWSSSAESIATVAGGLVTAVAAGEATIAAHDPVSGLATTSTSSAKVTVLHPLPTGIYLAPADLSLPAGRTAQVTATARLEDGSDVDVTALVAWSSSNLAVASVGNTPGSKGLVTALSDGVGSITARHPSGAHASVTIRVTPVALVRLVVTPTVAEISRGATQAFVATGTYTDGTTRDLTSAATWTSSDPSVAELSTLPGHHGTFVGRGPGAATISAREPMSGVSSDDDSSSAALTVTPPHFSEIAVLPITASIPLGETLQFQAFGIYPDGTSQEITHGVVWRSSNVLAATIDTTGLVTTTGQGDAVISAVDPNTLVSSDATGRSGVLTVTPPELVSIAVTPASRLLVVGSTVQLTATGLFTDGSHGDVTGRVEWRSSSAAASVAGGLVRAVGEGVATISARDPGSQISSDATQTSAVITVAIANLLSITVTPTSTTVPPGVDVRYSATGHYDNGASVDLTALVDWSASSSAAADLGTSGGLRGVATALAPGGITRIVAREPTSGVSSEGSSGSATLSVSAASTLVSLAVDPRPSTVDVGRTRALRALGTFADGRSFVMTNGVTWASSDASRARVSNDRGSRGVVTGVAVGRTTISAHTAAVDSDATSQSSAVTVEIGTVTAGETWSGPQVSIDGTPSYGVDVGSVTFPAGVFRPGAAITHVTVSIDFLKTDGTCASPASGAAYHGETNFRLHAPTGDEVILATPGTWSGGTAIQPVTIVFDQAAASVPSGTPASGAYLPNGGDLGALDGLDPTGTWMLQAGDAAGGDPLCLNAYTVTVTAE